MNLPQRGTPFDPLGLVAGPDTLVEWAVQEVDYGRMALFCLVFGCQPVPLRCLPADPTLSSGGLLPTPSELARPTLPPRPQGQGWGNDAPPVLQGMLQGATRAHSVAACNGGASPAATDGAETLLSTRAASHSLHWDGGGGGGAAARSPRHTGASSPQTTHRRQGWHIPQRRDQMGEGDHNHPVPTLKGRVHPKAREHQVGEGGPQPSTTRGRVNPSTGQIAPQKLIFSRPARYATRGGLWPPEPGQGNTHPSQPMAGPSRAPAPHLAGVGGGG